MSFRLNDEGAAPPDGGDDEIRKWQRLLNEGGPADQQLAAAKLVRLGAEEALTECLVSANELAVHLATGGLWECWLNEAGQPARREMEKGIRKMNQGELEEALELFGKLVKKYPRWAEAHNKQATVLYLLGNARLSYKVCQVVVGLKPNHFGAWNGLALCAAKLERWPAALEAARKALSLQPRVQANLDLIQLAQAKLAQEG
jgi:tetratricopeptide (TPR) repeat protein